MATAGLWMLATLAGLMVLSGLPSWLLLLAVSSAFGLFGVASGAFPLSLLEIAPIRLVGLLDNDLLQALPLYVLIGVLLDRLALADTLFRVASRTLVRTGADAPLAGLCLGTLLAPMNGSVGASVAMLVRSVYPRLAAPGLPAARGAALVGAASTLGVVVPPSLVLILLGDAMLRAHTEAVNITGASTRVINTQDVFRGALLPATLVVALTALVAWWTNRARDPATPRDAPPISTREAWTMLGTTGVIVALLTGVAFGYLYAVEAAATGGAALVSYAVATGTLRRPALAQVLRETLALTGALLALLIGATVFTLVLRAYGTDRWVAEQLGALGDRPGLVLLVALGAVAVCALVLDAFEMIFVVIPVVLPPLLTHVPDAAWVAVLTLLILQASFLVPPFGYAVLIVRQAIGGTLPARDLTRALLPYVAVQLTVLVLVVALPSLVLRVAPGAGPSTRPSEDEMRQMLQRQLDEQQQAPAPR